MSEPALLVFGITGRASAVPSIPVTAVPKLALANEPVKDGTELALAGSTRIPPTT
jgi:hypothetical protein